MGQYVLSVGVAALIVGILSEFTDVKSGIGVLMRMVCGLFLAISVIKPIGNLDTSYLYTIADVYDTTSQEAVHTGTKAAEEALREIIKAETEAYILDKASLYDLQLDVQVSLSVGDEAIPESVCLTGAASPYARTKLQNLIADELGIPKERQKWIG